MTEIDADYFDSWLRLVSLWRNEKRGVRREVALFSLPLYVTLLLNFLFAVGHVADLYFIHEGGVTP